LNVFPIAVPALRERADDIPLLVEYFIDRYARKAGKAIRRVSKRTLDHLRAYPWPGNVRELQNVIERSVIVCDTDEFTIDESWLSARPTIEGPLALSGTLAANEKAIIENALQASGGRGVRTSGGGGAPRNPALDARIENPRTEDQQKPLPSAICKELVGRVFLALRLQPMLRVRLDSASARGVPTRFSHHESAFSDPLQSPPWMALSLTPLRFSGRGCPPRPE
jgi:hypothetical protein